MFFVVEESALGIKNGVFAAIANASPMQLYRVSVKMREE